MAPGQRWLRPSGVLPRRCPHELALQLLYVIDRNRALTPSMVKAQFAVAEASLQDAHAAVEAAHNPARMGVENCGRRSGNGSN